MAESSRPAARLPSPKLRPPSVRIPIAVSSFAVALAIALLVGWTIIIVRYAEISVRFAENTWLLPTGIVGFAIILITLVVGSIYLVRQMLGARQQVRFIDSVTHELKSPLASLRLGLQTLGRKGLADRQREELREMMLDDVERLTSFIDGVLQASLIESDRARYDIEPVDLGELISGCAARVCRRHRVPAGSIVIDVPDELMLHTDRTALDTVVNNLLDNAVKYSDRPAEVAVNARREPGRIVVEVIDQGIGVPRAQLKRIFERFHRVSTPAVSARKGTGLGLYVVKSLVARLGGRLKAYSEGEGRGTRMIVTLETGQ